jgi:predicted ABC-type ATPase
VKEIILLGGHNGAGKTTAARVLLPEFLELHPFLNADEIARILSPGARTVRLLPRGVR